MISVSILSKKDDYVDSINEINNSDADFLHLDIMDNTFTDSISFDYDDSKKISILNNKKLDVHIMSNDLDNVLKDYIKLKPDIISFHFEATNKIKKYIDLIKKYNIKAGIAINPDTNVSDIYPYLNDIDVVLVMGVYAGKGGQKYIENTTEKLKLLKKLKDNYNYLIAVDGGINDIIVKEIKRYTDIIVCGSYITNSDDYKEKINKLK